MVLPSSVPRPGELDIHEEKDPKHINQVGYSSIDSIDSGKLARKLEAAKAKRYLGFKSRGDKAKSKDHLAYNLLQSRPSKRPLAVREKGTGALYIPLQSRAIVKLKPNCRSLA